MIGSSLLNTACSPDLISLLYDWGMGFGPQVYGNFQATSGSKLYQALFYLSCSDVDRTRKQGACIGIRHRGLIARVLSASGQ